MDQLDFQRELAAFDEKIALAELEVAKADERVKELVFQKNKFQLEYLSAVIKARAQQEQNKNADGSQKS